MNVAAWRKKGPLGTGGRKSQQKEVGHQREGTYKQVQGIRKAHSLLRKMTLKKEGGFLTEEPV